MSRRFAMFAIEVCRELKVVSKCSSSNGRRANRNARRKSQWDRDAEWSVVNRKGMKELS